MFCTNIKADNNTAKRGWSYIYNHEAWSDVVTPVGGRLYFIAKDFIMILILPKEVRICFVTLIRSGRVDEIMFKRGGGRNGH